MDALLIGAGSWASLLGAILSTAGLIATIFIAWGARSASRAARAAAVATNSRIESHLQSIHVERVIGLIQRIKLLHDTGRWEAALEQYQSLRMMLSGIIAHIPEGQTDLKDRLTTARTVVTTIENTVQSSIHQIDENPDVPLLNESLNNMQSALEELASAMGFGNLSEETA